MRAPFQFSSYLVTWGDGCAVNSRSPAPDLSGEWTISYDDTLDVEVRIGGAVSVGR
ncbi:MAG: hypothetical protein MJE77_47085 [Proteobacteria bacterium]|nr:hypothetical protein [Pseudomonadota bacterium]